MGQKLQQIMRRGSMNSALSARDDAAGLGRRESVPVTVELVQANEATARHHPPVQ
ncbi:hypothetical protein ACWCQZ_48100 [Streptomyces sp. NPDC002285]